MHEGNTGTRSLLFPVTLSEPASTTVTVEYTVSDGTAVGGSKPGTTTDYKKKSGALIFTPNARTGKTPVEKFVSIPVFADTASEADETLYVALSSVTGSDFILGRDVASGTILNDDGIVPSVTLGIGDASIVRTDVGNATLRFTVTKSSVTSSATTVSYALVAGTAAYSAKATGGDYGGHTVGTITIPGTARSKVISIPIWPSDGIGADKAFAVTLSAVSDPSLVVLRDTATGTILD
jgi:hypothetical protein